MEQILILNGSPRAPRSNSKRYGALFDRAWGGESETMDLLRADPQAVAERLETVSRVLLVFPLYADAIPVPVLRTFQAMEERPPRNRPTLSVLVNCGFLEPEQCDVAVDMVALFCKRMGWPMGSVLEIGSGEAILQTPFALFVKGAIQKLARAISSGKTVTLSTRMPLSQKRYVQEAERYWLKAGGKNGLSAQQMRSTTIESKGASSQKA